MSLPNLDLFQAIEPTLVAQGFLTNEVLLVGATALSSDVGKASNECGVPHQRFLVRPDGTVDSSEATAEVGARRSDGRVLVWCGPDAPASVAEITRVLDVDALAVATPADSWRTSAAMFDLGFVRIGTADGADRGVTGYLRSNRVRYPLQLFGQTRGIAAMSRLGSNGRFANQLFQYAFLRLYALRHELEVATPDWDGCDLFGISDPEPDPTRLTPLRFFAFDDDDLALWSNEAPPIDVDFDGYFQELPNCWNHHRELLRRLFRPKAAMATRLDAWVSKLTEGGRRPLVALHVRRGDYPNLFEQGLAWYRPIPLDWYGTWLEQLKSSADDLVIYVATDAPDEVLGAFRAFNPVTVADCPEIGVPTHIIDFEILRRADRLAVANSSFSRMSALLARDSQEVSIPSIKSEAFQPWAAWTERSFWDMFAPEDAEKRGFGSSLAAVRQRSLSLRCSLSEVGAELTRTVQSNEDQIAHRDANVDRLLGQIEADQEYIALKDEYIQSLLNEAAASNNLAAEKDDLIAQREGSINRLLHQVTARDERIGQSNILDVERMRTLTSTRLALTAAVAARSDILMRLSAAEAELRSLHVNAESFEEAERRSNIQVEQMNQENARLREALRAAVGDRDVASAARDEAMRAVHTALFLASPSGLARRLAFRPLMHALSVSSRVSGAVGLKRVSSKLRHDANVLRSRRYREWSDLLRNRIARAVRLGRLSKDAPSGRREVLTTEPATSAQPFVELPAEIRFERGSELQRVAEEIPGFIDSGRPGVVVVVPWLMQGGSEVVLLDVLQAVSVFVNISLITTLEARHTNADLFKPFVREIHHLEGDLQQDEAADFLVTLCRTRQARLLFSSNADLVYRRAGQLKAADPNLTIIDLLHNDLQEGHFASAVAAAPSIDRQVVVGSHIATALEKRGLAASRIVTIPNGIDTETGFNPRLTAPRDGRRFLGLKEGGFVLGFVGRMSPEKRPLAFLDIVEALNNSEDLRILMVGSGPLDAEIEARLGRFKHHTVWRRHLGRSDMAFVYAALDLLVVPSTIEGMPLAVIEAMAMSVPVAATDVGNIRQIVDDGSNGFIVDVDRYMELAQCVTDLARDRRRRHAMGQAARRAIIERGLTRSAMLDQYQKLFREATGTDI